MIDIEKLMRKQEKEKRMKDWNIVTLKEITDCMLGPVSKWEESFNALIAGKMQKGFTSIKGDADGFVCSDVGQWIDDDTHEALVITRPIRKEKPKCDHWKEINLGKRKFDFDFCPLCGEELK